MKNRFINDGKIDIVTLKHDMRGLVFPFEIGIKCAEEGKLDAGLEIQRGVFEKLKGIIAAIEGIEEILLFENSGRQK